MQRAQSQRVIPVRRPRVVPVHGARLASWLKSCFRECRGQSRAPACAFTGRCLLPASLLALSAMSLQECARVTTGCCGTDAFDLTDSVDGDTMFGIQNNLEHTRVRRYILPGTAR